MGFCGRMCESGFAGLESFERCRPFMKPSLYCAALSGPLRDDTREEVENMLNVCLAALDHQPLESGSMHIF